jgi:hypothetical protein
LKGSVCNAGIDSEETKLIVSTVDLDGDMQEEGQALTVLCRSSL